MSDGRDDEIAELKARLAAMETRKTVEAEPRSGTGFSRGFFGCFGVAAAIGLVCVGIVALGQCGNSLDQAPAPETPVLTGTALLRQQIGTEAPPAGTAEAAVQSAITESRIKSTLRGEQVKAFYFAGQPTVCGYLADDTSKVRFIHRNGAAVVETNHDPEAFNDFWKICQAAGL